MKCAHINGIKYYEDYDEIARSVNSTTIPLPGGGLIEFTHLYKANSEVFKQDRGGIQIYEGKSNITSEQMENTIKDFAALGIVPCKIVPQSISS